MVTFKQQRRVRFKCMIDLYTKNYSAIL